jgi:hypothetical protein
MIMVAAPCNAEAVKGSPGKASACGETEQSGRGSPLRRARQFIIASDRPQGKNLPVFERENRKVLGLAHFSVLRATAGKGTIERRPAP